MKKYVFNFSSTDPQFAALGNNRIGTNIYIPDAAQYTKVTMYVKDYLIRNPAATQIYSLCSPTFSFRGAYDGNAHFIKLASVHSLNPVFQGSNDNALEVTNPINSNHIFWVQTFDNLTSAVDYSVSLVFICYK